MGQAATRCRQEEASPRRQGPEAGRRRRRLEVDLDADTLERRRGRERNGRPDRPLPHGVQVRPSLTQVAVLEGRNLIEHYVSRPADDVSQIHGNIYLGKVQNVLPGMEAAFVDIGTPKNAVLYRGDVQYDPEDIVEKQRSTCASSRCCAPKQLIICQVTKNPIGAKGARLTQEVSLPGRFVVLIPNSKTYGISKRLPDDVRKRLRNILDRVKPAEHGLIVRTAAENATEHELRADMTRLLDQWNVDRGQGQEGQQPDAAVPRARAGGAGDPRGVQRRVPRRRHRRPAAVRGRRATTSPRSTPSSPTASSSTTPSDEGLPLYERHHIHEQLHKALDRKVWLPSGGSLIIEHTEALTVIDVNTGKNVGTSNLEETVYRNNLEAAEEVAKQLRLRDIGGIVVIDFIDMEIRENRRKVVDAFRVGARPRQDPHAGVRHLRARPGGDDPQAHRRGPAGRTSPTSARTATGRGVVIDHALLE